MHQVQIAHLDVKPTNIVLREGSGAAVLVDFGLAGRRLRTNCNSRFARPDHRASTITSAASCPVDRTSFVRPHRRTPLRLALAYEGAVSSGP